MGGPALSSLQSFCIVPWWTLVLMGQFSHTFTTIPLIYMSRETVDNTSSVGFILCLQLGSALLCGSCFSASVLIFINQQLRLLKKTYMDYKPYNFFLMYIHVYNLVAHCLLFAEMPSTLVALIYIGKSQFGPS